MNDQMEDHKKVPLDLIKEIRIDMNIYTAAMMNALDIYMAKVEIILDKFAADEKAKIEYDIFGTDALKVSTLKTDDESSNICIDNVVCEIENNELDSIVNEDKEIFYIDNDDEWDEDILSLTHLSSTSFIIFFLFYNRILSISSIYDTLQRISHRFLL